MTNSSLAKINCSKSTPTHFANSTSESKSQCSDDDETLCQRYSFFWYQCLHLSCEYLIVHSFLYSYLISGLMERVSPSPGDIKCGWKNKLSLWNELFTLGAEPLRWLNGSVTLNKFEWFVGLKLFKELLGMFTGAEAPCRRPVISKTHNKNISSFHIVSCADVLKGDIFTRNRIRKLRTRYIDWWCRILK